MIRMATRADLPAVLEIYNEAILNTTAVYTYQPYTLANREAWLDKKTLMGIPVLIFEQDGNVAGFATYGPFRESAAYQYTVEHSIYVHKDYRRLHIGAQLMEALKNVLNEKGYMTLIGAIDADNDGSCRMHEAMGFQLVGKIERAGYKFGHWLTLNLYQCQLKGPDKPKEE